MLTLARDGAEIVEGYLSPAECETLLEEVHAYTSRHELPLIERADGARSLRYRVIDGDVVETSFASLLNLYERVLHLVQTRDTRLEPLANRTARVNVNLTPPGGEYRWHYDRNSVTAILYLNAVDGGETEMLPHFRIHLGRFKDTFLQRALDRLLRLFARFRTLHVVAPAPGRMILMRGDRCLHSVRRVERGHERINVIMTFDLPGAQFRAAQNLDPYLYSRNASPDFDPNYRE